MIERFSRTEALLGKESMDRLARSRVIVFGVGGVGGYIVEALARSGVGEIDIVDKDVVDESNINRQIIALGSTVGKLKVDVAKERILEINPECKVGIYPVFYLPETEEQFDFSDYDYVIDAIDTVSGKMALIENAKKAGVPVISSMGAGNKLDPMAFRVADIYETSVCPLAKVIRKECRNRGIKSLKVAYSREEPVIAGDKMNKDPETGKPIPGSIAFVPSAMGLLIASEVVKDLINDNK